MEGGRDGEMEGWWGGRRDRGMERVGGMEAGRNGGMDGWRGGGGKRD